jgi:hypothetical protein
MKVAPQSSLEADPNLKLVSERSPYMRTERWYARFAQGRCFAAPVAHIAEHFTGKKSLTVNANKLPKAEHDAEEWQAAMQALLLVAEIDGPTMFARIGVMRALSRHVERC